MIKVTVSEKYIDPPICLYDPESRICFIPGKVVELDNRHLTILQAVWLKEGALVIIEEGQATHKEDEPAALAEMPYADLYRKAKKAGLTYSVAAKKERLIGDLAAAQKAAGLLTRPEGISNG